jgi:hypothetical protein
MDIIVGLEPISDNIVGFVAGRVEFEQAVGKPPRTRRAEGCHTTVAIT